MKTKIALSLVALAMASACTGIPTYDESTFPPQAVYGGESPTPTASLAKDATGK